MLGMTLCLIMVVVSSEGPQEKVRHNGKQRSPLVRRMKVVELIKTDKNLKCINMYVIHEESQIEVV